MLLNNFRVVNNTYKQKRINNNVEMSIGHNFGFLGTNLPKLFPQGFCLLLNQKEIYKWELITPISKYPVDFMILRKLIRFFFI